MSHQFIDTKGAAAYLNLKPSTLNCWRCRGEGPRFVKFGKSVRYRQKDLDEWVESRLYENTSQEARQ